MDVKRKRSENWSDEEKEILRELISQSGQIIETKCTKTTTNLLKGQEWKNILNKFNTLTGKKRSEKELKLAWKRMKMSAKANVSQHKQQQHQIGGGEKPPSPSQEDQALMSIAPYDFKIEVNDYDSDSVQVMGPQKQGDDIGEASCSTVPLSETVVEQVLSDAEKTNIPKKYTQEGIKMRKDTRDSIVESNINFKKRSLEMLEIEHAYNIKIAKLKMKRLELQIERESLEIKKIINKE